MRISFTNSKCQGAMHKLYNAKILTTHTPYIVTLYNRIVYGNLPLGVTR